MDRRFVLISKYLSFILRHRPEKIGLELDSNGWADLDELIAKANTAGKDLSLEVIEIVVETNEKQRFALSPDRKKIRANQGHSIAVDLELKATDPPGELFHGTATRFLESIKSKGLLKQNRHHVHLSSSIEVARAVGRRHGKPIILKADAEKMQLNGYNFYCSNNAVWLVDQVPYKFITELEET